MPAIQSGPTAEQKRAEEFRALGFTTTQAFLLAATRDGGKHVEAPDVKRMLDAGCAHEMALRILL